MAETLRLLCWPIAIGMLMATGANADAGNEGMAMVCFVGFVGHVLMGVFGGAIE